MSGTSSEEEDDCCKQLHKSTIIKIKPGKGHAVSANSEFHITSVGLDWKDDDVKISMSLWMQRGSDHFLLCTLDNAKTFSYTLQGRFNEPLPIRLYVKGNGDGSMNVFGKEKLKY